MSDIPTKVLSQHVRELLGGRTVKAAVFMTFTLEPAFFEEEIVGLLAGDTLIQEPKIRLIQLEEALRGPIGPVAVYYDPKGLRPDGPKKLDIRYIPVSIRTGLFHPKIVLLLAETTDPEVKLETALICGVLSANLTKSGWWSSLECAHFEEAKQGDICSYRDDLRAFLSDLRRISGRPEDHEALDTIRNWLSRETYSSGHATYSGRLRTRLIAGTRALAPFLTDLRGPELAGSSLEIISPFLDESRPAALRGLTEQLGVSETRVFLPTSDDGTALVRNELYDAVQLVPACAWARLPQEHLKLGKEKNAKQRGVHAKIYRFHKKGSRYEAIVVGSHNLTTSALGRGGNIEASFVIERENPGSIDWWLTVDSKKPREFRSDTENEESSIDSYIPLQLSYNWTSKIAEAFWGGGNDAGPLRVESAGSEIFTLSDLPVAEWVPLPDQQATRLEQILSSTSVLQVVTQDLKRASLLVQEDGMARKPSILLTWSVADVLEYWSRLTLEQKALYLTERGGNIPEGLPADLERDGRLPSVDNFFNGYAGIFHGFEMLRKQVNESIIAKHDKQAEYLLFGQRHDSLPRLLDKVLNETEDQDVVRSYLLLLSARQLLSELRFRREEFFSRHRSEIDDLIKRTAQSASRVAAMNLGDDGPEFITWFEKHFLKSVRSAEPETNA